MKNSIFLFILFISMYGLSASAQENMYVQTINIGSDTGTEYIEQPSESSEPLQSQSEQSVNIVPMPVPVVPATYVQTPFYYTNAPYYSYSRPGYSTGGGMVVHTNIFGHGYNFGGSGRWVSRPVGYSGNYPPPPPPPNFRPPSHSVRPPAGGHSGHRPGPPPRR